MEPNLAKEIEMLKFKQAEKEKDCEKHLDKTDTMQCQLLDPETGVFTRLTRIEKNQDNHGILLNKIDDTLTWATRGLIAGLVGILLSVGGWWISKQEAKTPESHKSSAEVQKWKAPELSEKDITFYKLKK